MDIFKWLIENKIAQNDYSAAAICNGLKVSDLRNDEAIKSRAMLYRKWRPKTDKKNEIPSWQAFQLAIAGIDPDDIEPRQIDMFDIDPEYPVTQAEEADRAQNER
jgi:hypothetical protein